MKIIVRQKSTLDVKSAEIVAHQSPGEHFLYVLGLRSALAEGNTFFQLNAVVTKIEYKNGIRT